MQFMVFTIFINSQYNFLPILINRIPIFYMENYSVISRKRTSYAVSASSLWWIVQGFAIMLTELFEGAWLIGLLLIGYSTLNSLIRNFSFTSFFLISLFFYSIVSFIASIIVYSVQGWMHPATGLLIPLAATNVVIAGYTLWTARVR